LAFLVIASLLWSVSFALIKSSGIHPDVLSAARLGLAALLFVPFLLRGAASAPAGDARLSGTEARRLPSRLPLRLAFIGAVQFGLMYVLVMRSYGYLAGHEVALLTITTPIFVVLFEAMLARRVAGRALAAALIAVLAALVLRWPDDGHLERVDLRGFALVGLANAAWALGQVLYRRTAPSGSKAGSKAGSRAALAQFGWMYVGGAAVAGGWAWLHTSTVDWRLDQVQIWKILYLGLIPSGLAFYLWNRGALSVQVGTLAVLNNLKVPLAVGVAVLPPFSESFDAGRLGACAALLLLALWLATWRTGEPPTRSQRP
jgi:drug/metabolite transporter (DMT)-like permease